MEEDEDEGDAEDIGNRCVCVGEGPGERGQEKEEGEEVWEGGVGGCVYILRFWIGPGCQWFVSWLCEAC